LNGFLVMVRKQCRTHGRNTFG